MLRAIFQLPVLRSLLAFLLARRVAVRGWSMYPTLAPGEYILFDRLAYRLGPPRKGEVVLASDPRTPSTRIIKRVVALPGDRVVLENGALRINDVPYVEAGGPLGASSSEGAAWTLADDEYFLLGDAPDMSTDARHFGPVRRKDILARAWLVYWPPRGLRRVRGQETA